MNTEFTSSANTTRLFSLIKQHLRTNKMSYKEIANKLEMSESGIKRIFSEKNCSLEKLSQICQAINLDFKKIFEFWSDGFIHDKIIIPPALDQYFAKHIDQYLLLRLLQKSACPEEEIEAHGYTQEDLKKLKKVLVKYDILKTQSIKSLKYSCTQFPAKSKTIKKLIDTWGRDFYEYASANQIPEGGTLLWSQHLSKSDAISLKMEMRMLLNKYAKIADLHKETAPYNEPEFTLLITSGFRTPGL